MSSRARPPCSRGVRRLRSLLTQRHRGVPPTRPGRVIRQEARALGSFHCFGAVGCPELLVDVLDVRLHGGTADAELSADAGERLIRGKEREDACLGWRQRRSLAGLVLLGRLRLGGNSAVTVRRGRAIRYRPLWPISGVPSPAGVGGAPTVRDLRPQGGRGLRLLDRLDTSLQQPSPAIDACPA